MILALSIMPTSSLPKFDWSNLIGFDKLAHLGVYSILSFLILYGANSIQGSKMYIKAIVVSSAYGVLMEILQFSFYTGRYFEILDIIANIIGSFLGAVFFKLLDKYFNIWKA